jgi:hypothetical protein
MRMLSTILRVSFLLPVLFSTCHGLYHILGRQKCCVSQQLDPYGEIHETLQICKPLTKRQIECFNNVGCHGFEFATLYRALLSFVNDPLIVAVGPTFRRRSCASCVSRTESFRVSKKPGSDSTLRALPTSLAAATSDRPSESAVHLHFVELSHLLCRAFPSSYIHSSIHQIQNKMCSKLTYVKMLFLF